ncbi:TRAP transporter small permease [Sediminimonas qiaohouensis]|uniref:TRAP transporter small permease n=1 Tax=Sediminimonas qiaohouensis TaxID=552061 RepID=UPI0003FAF8ED|nr:TRAP transporter small permease subunit [Sediminimonas qiaohouensis]
MRIFSALDAVLERTSTVLLAISGVALVAMMLQVTADVAAKYLLAKSIKGTLDVVTYYYMVALTFLPLAAVESGSGHISVELLTQALSAKWSRRVDLLSDLVSCSFFGVLGLITLSTAYGSVAQSA